MANANFIGIVGHICREPEMRTTPKGTSVCNCSIAYNNPRGKDDDTIFFGLTIWGRTGEAFAEYVHKGDCVLVLGEFKIDRWKKEGQERENPAINVDKWNFMGAPKGNSESAPAPRSDAALQQSYKGDDDDAFWPE